MYPICFHVLIEEIESPGVSKEIAPYFPASQNLVPCLSAELFTIILAVKFLLNEVLFHQLTPDSFSQNCFEPKFEPISKLLLLDRKALSVASRYAPV